eukprot:IDg5079t1
MVGAHADKAAVQHSVAFRCLRRISHSLAGNGKAMCFRLSQYRCTIWARFVS